jgi:hypothetical protein
VNAGNRAPKRQWNVNVSKGTVAKTPNAGSQRHEQRRPPEGHHLHRDHARTLERGDAGPKQRRPTNRWPSADTERLADEGRQQPRQGIGLEE